MQSADHTEAQFLASGLPVGDVREVLGGVFPVSLMQRRCIVPSRETCRHRPRTRDSEASRKQCRINSLLYIATMRFAPEQESIQSRFLPDWACPVLGCARTAHMQYSSYMDRQSRHQ